MCFIADCCFTSIKPSLQSIVIVASTYRSGHLLKAVFFSYYNYADIYMYINKWLIALLNWCAVAVNSSWTISIIWIPSLRLL